MASDSISTLWDFQTRLMRRLLVWSTLSVVFSALTIFSAHSLLRGIAIFGARASAKKQLKFKGDMLTETKEARWLERVLLINTALDVPYLLGGFWLMQTKGLESPLWRGHGLGIVIQGGFLFFFDFYHAFPLRNMQTT